MFLKRFCVSSGLVIACATTHVFAEEAPAPPLPSGAAAADAVGVKAKKKRRKKKAAAEPRQKRARLPAIHQRVGRRWMFLSPVTAHAGLGYARDWFLRDSEGAFAVLGGTITPGMRYSRGRFVVSAPLGVEHREAWGTPLRQLDAGAGLVASLRIDDAWAVAADGGAAWRGRPAWPDMYQPLLDDVGAPRGLRGTDRFGRTTGRAGLEGTWSSDPLRLSLRAELERRETPIDPAWDAALNPTHLVPGDLDRWGLALGARGMAARDILRYRATLRFDDLTHPLEDARDARTGRTHGGPGGAPPNPPLHERRWGLEAEVSARSAALATRFLLRGGVEHNDDVFDDYLTWIRWHAGAGATVKPWRTLALSLDYDLRAREYTTAGYAEGLGHPPLDWGDVRGDLEHRVRAEVAYPMRRRSLTPYLSARWLRSQTNFPDYAPYVYPAGAAYRIDWDRAALQLGAGLRAQL